MSNFIRQNEVNKTNEHLKVQQPLLESSSEMDKLQCITNTARSPVTKTTVMGTKMQYIGSLEAAEKHISAKIFTLLKRSCRSVWIFKIQCNDLCRTLQKKSCRSAQIRKDRKPGEPG